MESTPAIASNGHCLVSPVSVSRQQVATRTRIVLASTSRLLRDLLASCLTEEPDMEVVGSAVDPVDVLIAAGRARADVVILSWPSSGEMPGICTHLVAAHPDVLIIGIGTEGVGLFSVRQTSVSEGRGAVSLAGLLAAIRTAIPAATGL